MAIGDMNNDKHADIITVNNQMDHFTVHYYNPETLKYDESAPKAIDLMSGGQITIASIVISRDMNKNQSLLVVYNRANVENSFIKVFSANPQNGQFYENKDSDLNMLELYKDSQPFFLDINGDMM